MGGHEFVRVELLGEGYVLQCACGWQSGPGRHAADVGAAWDRHLAESEARPA